MINCEVNPQISGFSLLVFFSLLDEIQKQIAMGEFYYFGFFSVFLRFIVLLSLLVTPLSSAEIQGIVREHLSEKGIPEVLVILINSKSNRIVQEVWSSRIGEFYFTNVEKGLYKIEVRKEGFYSNIFFDLKIEENGSIYRLQIKMLKKIPGGNAEYCFLLGTIEVCAIEKRLLSEEPYTIREISRGEIEHLQATNLGDALIFLPGLELSGESGLSRVRRVALRDISIANEALNPISTSGTGIVVDGLEETNDADARWNFNPGVHGIDLREIPVDNIEKIEVITGIPPVEFSNFAGGVINLITRADFQSTRIKTQMNPSLRSVNFSSGLQFSERIHLDYNFNYSFSERDLREKGDEFQRIFLTSNLIVRHRQGLKSRLKLTYQTKLDDQGRTDLLKLKRYDRGYFFTGLLDIEKSGKDGKILSIIAGLKRKRRNYYKERWVTDQVVLEDTIYSGYKGILQEKGNEWNTILKLRRWFYYQGVLVSHQILTGLELNRLWNTGPGVLLDSIFNYYGVSSGRTSYSFKNYQDLERYALYLQDRFSGHVFSRKFQILSGLRLDFFSTAYHKKSIKENLFLSPRVNLRFQIQKQLWFRGGYGTFVRGVSLAYIYRPPAFLRYLQDSLIVIEKEKQNNPDLHSYRSKKLEIGVEYQFQKLAGISLLYFLTKQDDTPYLISYPWGYYQNPDTISHTTFSVYENRGWNRNNGVEILFKTRRFWNLRFEINANFTRSKTSLRGLLYDSSPDTSWQKVWYRPPVTIRKKIAINYRVSYLSQRLGIWVTLEAKQIPFSEKHRVFRSDYILKQDDDGKTYRFYQGMTKWYDGKTIQWHNRYYFTLRISKSIENNADISLYVENLLNDLAIQKNPYSGYNYQLNPTIFYGMEMNYRW